MLFGNLVFAFWVVFFGAEQCEVAIQVLFKFVVENDAERLATGALDACDFFLVKAVEIGIVFRFAGL